MRGSSSRQWQWSRQREKLWNGISDTEQDLEKGGDDDLFADVFEEQESLDKLTSIVENALFVQEM